MAPGHPHCQAGADGWWARPDRPQGRLWPGPWAESPSFILSGILAGVGREVKPITIPAKLLLGKCQPGLGMDPGAQQLEQLEPGVSLSASPAPAGGHTGQAA